MKPSASSGFRSSCGALGLLQVALGVAHGGLGLLLLQPALALLDVLQLELAALDLLPRGGQLLPVLDALELQVLLRLLQVGLGLREQGLAAADLLLEGRRVEEEERSSFCTSLPSGARATILAWLLWMVDA